MSDQRIAQSEKKESEHSSLTQRIVLLTGKPMWIHFLACLCLAERREAGKGGTCACNSVSKWARFNTTLHEPVRAATQKKAWGAEGQSGSTVHGTHGACPALPCTDLPWWWRAPWQCTFPLLAR